MDLIFNGGKKMPGISWLRKQFEMANCDVNNWPAWMQREAAKMNNKKYISSTQKLVVLEKNIVKDQSKEASNKKK